MNTIIFAAAVILAVIALTEIIMLFFQPCGSPAYVKLLPVFREDSDFQQRLEQLAVKSGGRCSIILVIYSADENQMQLCGQFIRSNPDTVIIYHDELEKILSETFAIRRNI